MYKYGILRRDLKRYFMHGIDKGFIKLYVLRKLFVNETVDSNLICCIISYQDKMAICFRPTHIYIYLIIDTQGDIHRSQSHPTSRGFRVPIPFSRTRSVTT